MHADIFKYLVSGISMLLFFMLMSVTEPNPVQGSCHQTLRPTAKRRLIKLIRWEACISKKPQVCDSMHTVFQLFVMPQQFSTADVTVSVYLVWHAAND